MFKTKKVTGPEFHHIYGPKISRVWNHHTQRGMSLNQTKNSEISLDQLTHIFIRDDGWTIASTDAGAQGAYELWPDEWDKIIELNQPRVKQ